MDTPKLCTKKLHDLSLPNALIVRKDGIQLCRECDKDKQRRWYHARYKFCKFNQARRLAGLAELTFEVYQHERETQRTRFDNLPGSGERTVSTNDAASASAA